MEDKPGTDFRIRGARVIDPARAHDAIGDLFISGGRIASEPAAEAVDFDAGGLIACPGLIDIHVHLREPGQEHKGTIATECRAAVAGGFTAVACMPNTEPAIDRVEVIDWIRRRSLEVGLCRVYPIAAVTMERGGRQLVDFVRLREAGAVAFSDDGVGVADEQVMQEALQAVRACGTVLIQHCEDAGLSSNGVMTEGPTCRRLDLSGQDPGAEAEMIRRDIELVRRTGARYHVAHISTAASVALVREAKTAGLPVSAEVCPHHLLLTDEACAGGDANFKMNPPLRSRRDVEACLAGLLDGTIDCLVTDHAPHTAEEKARGFAEAPFGIVGLETALGLMGRLLIETGRLDWPDIIRQMSVRPAEVLGRDAPSLAAGRVADVTVIDPQARWTIDPERFVGGASNSPFGGWKARGRAVCTLVNGRACYLHPDYAPRFSRSVGFAVTTQTRA